MNRRDALGALAALASTTWLGRAAAAKPYPQRPVTLIVPYSPGGATDNVARVIAEHLQARLGQPVIIDNRAGANGRIGTLAVARAAPDGYVLLLGGIGPITIAPHLEKVPYDPFKDFAPVSLLVKNDVVLLVNPAVPARKPEELIALLKAEPGKFNYASSGTGGPFHLSGELFKSMAGVEMTHVPYKGDGPALVDLMAGNVQVMFTTISASAAHIQAGKAIALASAGEVRSSQMPDLPTLAESALPGFASETWQVLFAPGGTPAPTIDALQAGLAGAMRDARLRQALQAQGNSVVASDVPACAQFVRDEYEKWGNVVRKSGLAA
ncbi:tripartite tricarboxylate transporter substrate binding protein [Bordetella parapertussis]|uniref:Exported protein n=2 Tax=Bordetella parapertussis TaxID=519 RepID=Q7W709_BORPA|nr:tripartite tricarboxylate transporter substrate binding protein [Bordetella parapertussis]AOB39782.1 hypothetical protein BBB43_13810 [Bordetella parapertussis]AUL43793.1 hypothetical protein BTL54_13915 [Bordetella parapertussis]AWP62694.1 hypothetical protein B7P06_08145 [Bordetella parapertussis]AWP70192.1 hypothetical protein B7O99_08140 [Bordetella parapertussis]AWP89800.1 hypothetical protein B7P05_13910 [Bordetella parapertussis]